MRCISPKRSSHAVPQPNVRPADTGRPGRIRAGERSAAGRKTGRCAVSRHSVRVRLDRADGLSVDDLAATEQSGNGHAGARASRSPAERQTMTAGHFIFIPAVLLVGVVIGWILGSRAARDAYAAELRRREERATKAGRAGEAGEPGR